LGAKPIESVPRGVPPRTRGRAGHATPVEFVNLGIDDDFAFHVEFPVRRDQPQEIDPY
jgi:hypothetical protein